MAKINSLFSVAVILTFIVIVTRSSELRRLHTRDWQGGYGIHETPIHSGGYGIHETPIQSGGYGSQAQTISPPVDYGIHETPIHSGGYGFQEETPSHADGYLIHQMPSHSDGYRFPETPRSFGGFWSHERPYPLEYPAYVKEQLKASRQTPILPFSHSPIPDKESVLPTGDTEIFRNCKDIYENGDKNSGVYVVYPFTENKVQPLSVYCDQTTDGGGWTVFQRRTDKIRENFFRLWADYKKGFGEPTGEFWLGLDNIHAFTEGQNKHIELRVDLEDFDGNTAWAKYGHFVIGDVAKKYSLHVGTYSGNATNSLFKHDNQSFSAPDNDNTNRNCATHHQGGWWFFDTDCYTVYLNGNPSDGIVWNGNNGLTNPLKFAQMSLRPK